MKDFALKHPIMTFILAEQTISLVGMVITHFLNKGESNEKSRQHSN